MKKTPIHRVCKVEPRKGHRLYVAFEDGVSGEVDLSDRLFGPVFEPLKNPEYFAKAEIDDFGAVCWPNGADLAPDALHAKLSDEPSHRPDAVELLREKRQR